MPNITVEIDADVNQLEGKLIKIKKLLEEIKTLAQEVNELF